VPASTSLKPTHRWRQTSAKTRTLRLGPFRRSTAHEPVPVRYGYDDLSHSIVSIFGGRADRPSRRKFGVQAVGVIDFQIAKLIVRTKRARVHIGGALAKHDPNAVPLDQSPTRCMLPTDMEAKDVVKY
jgi:hypothetical protein